MTIARVKPRIWRPGINRQDPLAVGLVGLWSFQEGAGSTVRDLAGGNDGDFVGMDPAVSWVNGDDGYGVEFTADSTEKIDIPDTPALNFASDFSVVVRASYTGTTRGYLIAKGTWNSLTYSIRVDHTGFVNAFVLNTDNGGFLGFINSASIKDTGLRHIAMTVSGDTLTVYLDGEIIGSDSTPTGTRRTSNANPFTIGNYTFNNSPYHGIIDQVASYNRALSPAEIQALYNDPYRLITPPSTLVYSILGGGGAPPLPPTLKQVTAAYYRCNA